MTALRRSLTAAIALAIVTAGCSSHASRPAPLGIGPVSAEAFAQRGIYLGPPGTIPIGVPSVPPATPATTSGNSANPHSTSPPGPEQLAVRGDRANGTAKVTEQEAKATTLKNLASFVGPVTLGTPRLVQLDNVNVPFVATVWAIRVSGTVELAGGPPPTDGGSVRPIPRFATTAIVFVDAVTGKFISEEVFGSVHH